VVADSNDPSRLARFWAEALGWRIVIDDEHEVEIAGSDTDVNVIFGTVPEPKSQKNRIHFDLHSSSNDQHRGNIERLVALGAKRIDIGQREVAWTVMADPEGNEFCVEPESVFASETGPVGAIAYDALDPGRLGRFWSEASGWPIVDQGDWGVALRAPSGTGPFITFGGGIERTAAKSAKNRWHLDVAPPMDGDQGAEVERLIMLGARRIDIGQGDVAWVVMADPEDNEFCVLTPR
jgi:predicted enzyme related to lactoylglutathione lyase